MSSHSLFVGSLFVLVGLTSCQRAVEPAPTSSTQATPVKVRLAAVETSTVSPLIRVGGVLARQTEAELSFAVGGVIERVSVRPGDRVSKNQELARLQSEPFEAQLVQVMAVLDKARRNLGRVEKLQSERVATLEDLQDGRTAVDQAAAALRLAEFNRRHSSITAPQDGVILRRLAEPNELVAGGRAVLTFASEQDGWIVKCGLTPRDAARITLGAGVELNDSTGALATGKVVRLAEAIDAATGTLAVEARLDSLPSVARSGLVVSVAITPKPVAARAVIPLAALREGAGQRAAIFLVEGSAVTAKQIWVDVEQVDGERVYLRTVLPPQARVVVAGGQFVREGEAFAVTEDVPAAAAR